MASALRTRAGSSPGGTTRCSTSGYAMFSPTVSESKSAPCWKSIATFRRIGTSASSSSPARATPSTSTSPASGRMSPFMCFKSTLFPDPLPPSTTTVSPVGTSRSRPRSTSFGPKDFPRPRQRMKGAALT